MNKDYHISVHAKDPSKRSGVTSQPIQSLRFSVYGPNNQDSHMQAAYRRTKDDFYIQSLPTGEIIAFKAGPDSHSSNNFNSPLWGQPFNDPM
jgi:serine/threonine-protein kinase/endoribonuclease IRE1